MNFYCGFISQKWVDTAKKLKDEKDPDYMKVQDHSSWQNALRRQHKELYAAEAVLEKKLPRPPLSDLIDHIDHMVKVAGVDHVGLGSDFDGIDCSPQGIDSAADLPKITRSAVPARLQGRRLAENSRRKPDARLRRSGEDGEADPGRDERRYAQRSGTERAIGFSPQRHTDTDTQRLSTPKCDLRRRRLHASNCCFCSGEPGEDSALNTWRIIVMCRLS